MATITVKYFSHYKDIELKFNMENNFEKLSQNSNIKLHLDLMITSQCCFLTKILI